MSALNRFYLIVDDADWIARLVPVGVKLVQLRFKGEDDAEVCAQVRRSKEICQNHGSQLIVNDHWQAAIDEACDYVHLGQGDLDHADVPAIKRAGIRLGISTHDDTELERALLLEPDYVALGPVYPTILKKMPWAPQGVEKLTLWKQRIGDIPLVAIGGLRPERLSGVFAAGADSAAVVTDITLNEDPEARTREWIAATRPVVIGHG